MDYQALPPSGYNLLASPDRMVERLLQRLRPGGSATRTVTPAPHVPGPDMIEGRLSVEAMARTIVETLAPEKAVLYMRLPLGCPGQLPVQRPAGLYYRFDGGGGIGSGPGKAAGAHGPARYGQRQAAGCGSGRRGLPDGRDGAVTAVHYKVPMLVLVSNNRSFFNE